ncbi:sensor histidine kinase, partial [gut metagenome]
MVIGFVIFNGSAIILMCCGWFFAIPVAIIYSGVLYYLLKKKYAKTHEDYQKVLDIAQKMANGDLEAPADIDAGMYEPLKNQLYQVREGFQKAVDAEVKSQRMKTELITNVSHDLKTPLTAIITYVDLLKKPDITDEEQADYIKTLEKKSQRLKQLIADLFDVSKAVSREMTP